MADSSSRFAEVLRPFALRHVRVFLRRNYWLLAGIALFFIFRPYLRPITKPSQWFRPLSASTPAITILPPEQFSLAAVGSVLPAIDPEGRLVPMFTGGSFPGFSAGTGFGIWNLKTERAVAHVAFPGAEYVRILFNHIRNEIVFCVDSPYSPKFQNCTIDYANLQGSRGVQHIAVLDAQTGALKQEFVIPGAVEIVSVSPSGSTLAIKGLGLGAIEFGSESIFQLWLLDLDSGEIERKPIFGAHFFFESNDTILSFLEQNIVRFRITEHDPKGKRFELPAGTTSIDFFYNRYWNRLGDLTFIRRDGSEKHSLCLIQSGGEFIEYEMPEKYTRARETKPNEPIHNVRLYYTSGSVLAARGLVLVHYETNDYQSQTRTISWSLCDLKSGQESEILKPIIRNQNHRREIACIFLNEETIAVVGDGPVRFVSISDFIGRAG